jgi:hypothetical protein
MLYSFGMFTKIGVAQQYQYENSKFFPRSRTGAGQVRSGTVGV